MAITGNDGKVDLDEVRRGTDGRLGERRCRGRIGPKMGGSIGCCERGQLCNIGCRLADLEWDLGGPDERGTESEVSLLRGSGAIAHRHEDLLEDRSIIRPESCQAGT